MRAFGIARVACAARAAAAILLVLFGNAANAQEPLKIFGLTIPDRVGGLPHGQLRDYETTTPGLGYSIPFQRPGWLIDVFIYDFRMSSIPEDPNSEVMKNHLSRTKDDVFELERRGNYANVAVKGDYAINDLVGRARFVCSAFTYVHKGIGATVDSYLCLTSWKNKFFKIRMTAREDDTTRADAAKFVEAWFSLLWPS